MPPSKSDRSSATRLRRVARPLRPVRDPYYVHNPGPGSSSGPGWYWIPDGSSEPAYVAYNELEAAIALRRLVDQARDVAAGAAA